MFLSLQLSGDASRLHRGSPTYITSIDPDGGPYLSIGKIIRSYQIKKIISYHPLKGKKDTMKIVLEVGTL